jgi:tRNA pseudouridine55 synthase
VDRVLVIDKPSGMTSHDVVQRVRRSSGVRRVGHAGTLDPSATGVLVVLVGRATRLAHFLADDEKHYRGEMILGTATDTQDATGEVVATEPTAGITRADIERTFADHVGTIEQVPPMASAIKQDGVRLYVLARKGITVPRKPRRVVVHRLALLEYRQPVAEFEVTCSKGTYVRTLAHDVGRALGCGAHLGRLRRERSGRFRIADAVPLGEVERARRALDRVGLSMFEACDPWPSLEVDRDELNAIATGTAIEVDQARLAGAGGLVRITADGRTLAAVGRCDRTGGGGDGPRRIVRPVRVFVEPVWSPGGGGTEAATS